PPPPRPGGRRRPHRRPRLPRPAGPAGRHRLTVVYIRPMTGTVTAVQGEPRMLIDGELVDAAGGGTFENVNPADEEVLGVCADGSADDMRRAIAAARRAFDGTAWSTDNAFRRRCLEQLQSALDKHREELRRLIVAEVGTPVLMTYTVQTDAPIDDLSFWAQLADGYEYERWLSNR